MREMSEAEQADTTPPIGKIVPPELTEEEQEALDAKRERVLLDVLGANLVAEGHDLAKEQAEADDAGVRCGNNGDEFIFKLYAAENILTILTSPVPADSELAEKDKTVFEYEPEGDLFFTVDVAYLAVKESVRKGAPAVVKFDFNGVLVRADSETSIGDMHRAYNSGYEINAVLKGLTDDRVGAMSKLDAPEVEYDPSCGSSIEAACETAVELSKLVGSRVGKPTTVKLDFNGVKLSANADTIPGDLAGMYSSETKRRNDEYLASDEYKAAEAAAQKRQEESDAAFHAAMCGTPDEPTFKDPEGWAKATEVKEEEKMAGYAQGIFRWAKNAARFMEKKVAEGKKVAEVADEAFRVTDNEGFTGNMYGWAVRLLSQFWVHGEELRQWHNAQYGDQGAKANKKDGAVINPAVLVVK